jgi:hypothetical protein
MKPKFTYFYHKGCNQCKELYPLIKEISNIIEINLVDTYENSTLVENISINWVPTFMIEDNNGNHIFEGPIEVKNVLKKLIK